MTVESHGRYSCKVITVEGTKYKMAWKPDKEGTDVLFQCGDTWWLVPLVAGVPCLEVKVEKLDETKDLGQV